MFCSNHFLKKVVEDQNIILVGSYKTLDVFKIIENSFVNIGSLLFNFKIESIECYRDLVITNGQLNCCIDRFSIYEDKIQFENIENISVEESVRKVLFLSNKLVMLFSKSVGILSLTNKNFVKCEMNCYLTDITVVEDQKTFVLILDKNGQIWFIEKDKIILEAFFITEFVVRFKDASVCSFFYNACENALYFGHDDGSLSKIIIQISAASLYFSSEDKTRVKVRPEPCIDL